MPPDFATLLLAGGRSRRMGADKALLEWLGRPLWQVQAEKLRRLGGHHCFIACREEQGLQEAWPSAAGIEWLFDPPGDDRGPLGAIGRVLRKAQAPTLVLAVDMPFISEAFLSGLACEQAAAASESGLFCQTEQGVEPMAGIYVPAMLPLIEARLARGELGLQRLIAEAAAQGLARLRPANPGESGLFANLNTPGEWQDCLLANDGRTA